jgi:hypothetical protein
LTKESKGSAIPDVPAGISENTAENLLFLCRGSVKPVIA